MKKIILLMLIVSTCFAQKIDTSFTFKISSTHIDMSHTVYVDSFYRLMIYGSGPNAKKVAWLNKDSVLIVKDSLETIKTLIFQLYGQQHWHNETIKRYSREIEISEAAGEILRYLSIQGVVTDRKKFDKAVKQYRKIISK